jgi:hypothetical protein
MLKQLWLSTINLHRRFNAYPPNAQAVKRVVQEEFREFMEAAAEIDAILKLPPEQRTVDDLVAPREHLAQEAADLLVTMCAYLIAYGVTRRAWKRAAKQVEDKNNLKDATSHEVNPKTGKIQRRKAASDG